MKITIHASLDFKEEIINTYQYLKSKGIEVLLPDLCRYQHIRDELKNDELFTKIKTRLTRENFQNVTQSDVILILNYDHRNIKNYVGGNSFMEMVIAFYLNKPIYLLNAIPEGMPYTEEIKSLRPIVIGSLEEFVKKYSKCKQ